jgi:hypothetical protein
MNKQNFQKKRKGEGDIKKLYNITRKLSQRKFKFIRPIKTKSGTLLTQEEQMNRWEEHFY